MKKSRKEFIKRAHSSACQDWKQEIEKEFPKLFKKTEYKTGIWYTNNVNSLVFSERISNPDHGEYIYGYGWHSNDGKWWNNEISNVSAIEFTPATNKEVEEALIKEAKKRGFKKGVSIKRPIKWGHVNSEVILNHVNGFDFVASGNTLETIKGREIFRGGRWATIIETITKEEAEKQLGKTITC